MANILPNTDPFASSMAKYGATPVVPTPVSSPTVSSPVSQQNSDPFASSMAKYGAVSGMTQPKMTNGVVPSTIGEDTSNSSNDIFAREYPNLDIDIQGILTSKYMPVVGPVIEGAYTAGKNIFNNLIGSVGDLINKTVDSNGHNLTDYQTMTPDQVAKQPKISLLQKGTALGNVALNAVNLYPPWLQFQLELSAAKKLPGVAGLPAQLVDQGFQKIAQVGSDSLTGYVSKAQDTGLISPATAKTITPLMQGLGGLVTSLTAFHIMKGGIGGETKPLTVMGEFKADDGTPMVDTKEQGSMTKADYIRQTGQTGVYSKLPMSEKAKQSANRWTNFATGMTMTPFSTAFGIAHGMLAGKIAERQQAGTEITPEEGKKIVAEVKSELPRHVEIAMKKNAEWKARGDKSRAKQAARALREGYEPITPDSQLPTIQAGKTETPKSNLPTIQVGEGPNNELGKIPGTKYVPVKEEAPTTIPKGETPLGQTMTAVGATKGTEQSTESEMKPTKASLDINQKLVEKGKAALTPEQQSQYNSKSYKGSEEWTASKMTTDIESAKDLIRHPENIPNNVYPPIVWNAMDKWADENKDFELSRDLAKSPIGTQTSEAGGTLGSKGYNNNPDSGSERLKQANVSKAGGEKTKKAVDTETKRATETISKTRAKLIDYENILDKITCK